jgi:hypothetical protein
VAIDLIFTDGTALRNLGAVDQHGNQVHPAHQCGHLNLDQWNQVISNIGAVANGKTISKLDEGYDQPANTGGYRGYIDDISLSNPASNTPSLQPASRAVTRNPPGQIPWIRVPKPGRVTLRMSWVFAVDWRAPKRARARKSSIPIPLRCRR